MIAERRAGANRASVGFVQNPRRGPYIGQGGQPNPLASFYTDWTFLALKGLHLPSNHPHRTQILSRSGSDPHGKRLIRFTTCWFTAHLETARLPVDGIMCAVRQAVIRLRGRVFTLVWEPNRIGSSG